MVIGRDMICPFFVFTCIMIVLCCQTSVETYIYKANAPQVVKVPSFLTKISVRPSTRLQGTSVANSVENEQSALPPYMLKLLARAEAAPEKLAASPMQRLPIIAVIGRPNTGKSTIVNRISESFQVCSFIFKMGVAIELTNFCNTGWRHSA